MFDSPPLPSRRTLLRSGLVFGAAGLLAPEVFAEQLLRTPRMTEGPFYPDQLPLDRDNDLLIVNKSITQAVGVVTHLTGRVLTETGEAVRNALVEIWQCDANAVYLHTSDSGPKKQQRDKNFQGFGRFETDAEGRYRFRTIKPVPYPGRPAPHIHVKVKQGQKTLLTTQLLMRGHPGNEQDGVFRDLGSAADRERLLVDFKPMQDSQIGELSAYFEIVLGRTLDEEPAERRRGGPGPGRRGPPPGPPPTR